MEQVGTTAPPSDIAHVNGPADEQPVAPPTNQSHVASPTRSYSDVTKKSTPQYGTGAPFASYLKNRSRLVNDRSTLDGQETLFSCHSAPHLVGIPFDPASINIQELSDVVHEYFPGPLCEALFFSRAVIYAAFVSDEERERALSKPMPFKDTTVPVLPVIRSTGVRLNIRSDFITVSNVVNRRKALEELFAPYGKIIYQANYRDHEFNQLRAHTHFTLEVRRDAPEDLEIPRVAKVGDTNALFAWGGVPFCYRCGHGDHLKAQCPQPHDYAVWDQLDFLKPIMARAFPPKNAPPRVWVPKQKKKNTASSDMKTGRNKDENDGFTVQKNKRYRGGQPISSGSTPAAPAGSGSESEDSRPLKKKDYKQQNKENHPNPHLPVLEKEDSLGAADDRGSSSVSHQYGQQPGGAETVKDATKIVSTMTESASSPKDGHPVDLPTPVTSGSISATDMSSENQEMTPAEPSEESKIVHDSSSIGRKNSICITDVKSLSSVPQIIDQNPGGADAAVAVPIAAPTTAASAPASNKGPSAGVSEEVTTDLIPLHPAGNQEEGRPSSLLGTPGSQEKVGQNQEEVEEAEEMEGIELTEAELMELDDPETSPERRKALRATIKRRANQAKAKMLKKQKKFEELLDGKGGSSSSGGGRSSRLNPRK